MKLKKRNSLLFFLLLYGFGSCAAQEPLVGLDSTDELRVYRLPEDATVGWVCGHMPNEDTSVLLCVEAAFTHAIQHRFSHANIDGDHVCDGVKCKGAECRDNTGMFAFYGGQWRFVYPADASVLDSAATDSCGLAFGQTMLIYRKALTPVVRRLTQVAHFRSLCEKDGELCVVESKDTVTFGHFLYLLAAFGVENALYLDMGSGWNHSWYRLSDGSRREIYPYRHPYCTNWLVFRKK